jgi:hypothetical protein
MEKVGSFRKLPYYMVTARNQSINPNKLEFASNLEREVFHEQRGEGWPGG